MGRHKKHRTRARARFEREHDLDTRSSSSMTPERDSDANKTETDGETRSMVESGSPRIATSTGSDSECELEKELENLEREKKALCKQALLNRIKEVKGEILALNQSSKSKLPFSNVGSQNQNVASAGARAVDRLNLDDLRELETLQEEVDSQMKSAGQIFGEDDSDVEIVEDKRSSKGKKSGLHYKPSDFVCNPQIWPHTLLEFQFVTRSLEYKDLDFQSFVAGELEILTSDKIGPVETKYRLINLKHIVYLDQTYEWQAIREMHAAKLRLIERKKMSWGSDFSKLESQMLAPHVKVKKFQKQYGHSRKSDRERIFFCKDFQSGQCSKDSLHTATVKGKLRTVQHVCAVCLLKDKEARPHKESDQDCPNRI